MSIKNKYTVKLISNKDAEEWFLFKHYAKRKPSVSYCYGLFLDEIMQGVCAFGNAVPPYLAYQISEIVHNILNPKPN